MIQTIDKYWWHQIDPILLLSRSPLTMSFLFVFSYNIFVLSSLLFWWKINRKHINYFSPYTHSIQIWSCTFLIVGMINDAGHELIGMCSPNDLFYQKMYTITCKILYIFYITLVFLIEAYCLFVCLLFANTCLYYWIT